MSEGIDPSSDVGPRAGEPPKEAIDAFRETFGRAPSLAASAPGRVNLIGEHTDYNDGFVLPMAIEHRTWLVAAPSSEAGEAAERSETRRPPGESASDRAREVVAERCVRVHSTWNGEEASFAVRDLEPEPAHWSNYVRGVVASFARRGFPVHGFDAVIHSTVPTGAGLSSSAALEVATATLIEALAGRTIDPVEKALLCQQAEHEFAGMPCGVMDQFIATMGCRGHALLIDCRSYEADHVPLSDEQVRVLIVDSRVKHELVDGAYAKRRAECEAAADRLDAPRLRDVLPEALPGEASAYDDPVWRRARHVVHENLRTLDAAAAMTRGDWEQLGRLMNGSHESLRDDFEVSCEELDLLVRLAREQRGVLGSRMTGGGFGGATVSLVRREAASDVEEAIRRRYREATGLEARAFLTVPADGAIALPLERSRQISATS